MKLCIVWDSFISLDKSARGDISQIVGMATALAQQKVDVSLVALNAGNKKINDVKIYQAPNLWFIRQRTRTLGRIFPKIYGYDSFANARHVAKFLAKKLDPIERFDLYHVRDPRLAIELKRLQPDKPLVFISIPRYFHSKLPSDKILDQKAIDSADKIITFTQAWKEYNMKDFDLKGRDIAVIPVCAKRPDKMQEPELPEHIKNKKLVGYFGRLQETYGIDTLIKAIPQVKAKFDNVGFIIAGSSHNGYDRKLKGLANSLELHEDIFFAGEIPHNLVSGYLEKCSVLVSLRHDEIRHRYGFDMSIPIKCVEYIMHGKPVIATRDGGMEQLLGKDYPYLVDHGNNSQLVESFIRLLTDESENQKISKENLEKSIDYTYESVANQLINVYKETLSLNTNSME